MNPLQKHPHLFANGEFQVRVDYGAEIVSWTLTPDLLAQLKRNNVAGKATLIARPIEDMTDEEKENAPIEWEYFMKCWKRHGEFEWEQGLYLLSIGVYFGPQSHFEDGTVIDNREVA